jgi:hypothetical protein
MKKILICTTFREFNGDSNDAIQHLFLDSLKKQTYSNWELIVTVFSEKNIKKTLDELHIPNKVFHDSSNDYRFSLTEVFLNGINSIEGINKNIILWTTCDVIFDDNLFAEIIKNYAENICGSSHPHVHFETLEDLRSGKNLKQRPSDGIDTIFFDANIFLKEENQKTIRNYKNTNWGLFEHFLTAVGKMTSSSMINLWGVSNIRKIFNDRKLNNENSTYLKSSWSDNLIVLNRYLENNNLTKKYLDLLYCHQQFDIKIKYKYILKFWKFYIQNFCKKMSKLLKSFIPKKVKLYLKKLK